MPRRWNSKEEKFYRDQLREFYIIQNKSIAEIAFLLEIRENTVYDRLIRLGIPVHPEKKEKYLNKRTDISIPRTRSEKLAEFFGMMMGDGKLSPNQIMVTLGNKEDEYALYICSLMKNLFGAFPKIIRKKPGEYITIYMGSVTISRWLYDSGFAYNKVISQVDAPRWISKNPRYMEAFIRGFFDTDGSVYEIKYGIQISFTNYSKSLLISLQKMLLRLKYRVSKISGPRFYITKRSDIERFFIEIRPQNKRHIQRFGSLNFK